MATVALADDHVLLRKGLATLIENLGHQVIFEADNGEDLIKKLKSSTQPELLLLDINMPVKNGYDTAIWLKAHYPLISILALSMYDNENAIIRMLRCGAKGYILKDCEPQELQLAINAVTKDGYYHSKMVSGKLINAINHIGESGYAGQQVLNVSEREMEFLKFCCTELTYKEIADQMNLSPRTIDGYRDALFEKLGVKTRTGLVLFAIKNGIVNL